MPPSSLGPPSTAVDIPLHQQAGLEGDHPLRRDGGPSPGPRVAAVALRDFTLKIEIPQLDGLPWARTLRSSRDFCAIFFVQLL